MQDRDERDQQLIGHLLALRAVHEATLINIDAMLQALAGEDEEGGAVALREPAAPRCPHAHKIDTTPAGSAVKRWYCSDCGETFEVTT